MAMCRFHGLGKVEMGCVSGQNMFIMWFPMEWAYQNLNVYVIWALEMLGAFQKRFEGFWSICSLDTLP